MPKFHAITRERWPRGVPMRRERGHAFRKRQVSDNHLVLTRRGWIERALLAATWGVGVPAAAQNAIRVALVIGNSTYSNAPLPNAAHDARAVSAVLADIGFHVVEVSNAGKARMDAAIAQMTDALKGRRGVGLFFYAGHGLQLDWHNYLVPVNAELGSVADVSSHTVDIQTVMDAFKAAGNRMSILVLDACRDNPFGTSASGKGLAPLDAAPGTYIAYATAPGNVAEDGTDADGNGLYTRFLLKELQRSDARIEEVFKRVRLQVRQASQGRQVPWDMSSLEEDFIFARGVVPAETLSGTARDKAFEREKAAWDRVKKSTRSDDLYTFLQAYPTGYVAEVAQGRLEQLQKSRLATRALRTDSPRYVVGDHYVYDAIDGFTKGRSKRSLTVTAITDAGVSFNGDPPSRTIEGGVVREFGLRFDPPIVQYPSDMETGKRWLSAYVVTWPDGSQRNDYWDFKVLAQEDVTVPAGRFHAFRVSGHGDGASVLLGFSHWTITYWVDVETLVLLRHDYMSRGRRGEIIDWNQRELVYMERKSR